jgi:hypothetical protein
MDIIFRVWKLWIVGSDGGFWKCSIGMVAEQVQT